MRKSAALGALGLLLATGLGALAGGGPEAAAKIANVRLEKAGRDEIVVSYDLEGAPGASVWLIGSADGGRTFGLRVLSVGGHAGEAVAPGSGRRLWWFVSRDYPAAFPDEDVVLDVVADLDLVQAVRGVVEARAGLARAREEGLALAGAQAAGPRASFLKADAALRSSLLRYGSSPESRPPTGTVDHREYFELLPPEVRPGSRLDGSFCGGPACHPDPGEGQTAFRAGSRDLHAVHAPSKHCVACHAVNLDGRPVFATEAKFAGRFSVPVRITRRGTGGRCVVGCHKEREY